jgi:DNA-binding beta-propeller fold protein YncE
MRTYRKTPHRRRWLVPLAVASPALALAAGLGPVGPALAGAVEQPAPAHVDATVSVAVGSLQTVALGDRAYVLSINELSSSSRTHSVVTEVDPATNTKIRTLDLGLGSVTGNHTLGAIAAGAGAVWVTDFDRNVLDKIDPTTLTVTARIRTGTSPTSVTVAFGSVWVSHEHDARMWRIDPSTDQVTARVQVDDPATYEHSAYNGLTHLAADSTGVLETIGSRDVVVRVSPTTNSVVATYDVSPAEDCGLVVPVPGGFWLDDIDCSWDVWHYSYSTQSIVGHFATDGAGCMFSLAAINGQIYVADSLLAPPPDYVCTVNTVQRLDSTGQVTATRVLPAWPGAIPPEAGTEAVQSLFGDFWVETGGRHVFRIAAF